MRPDVTRHAAARMHQRAVPPLVVEWLQQYGAEEHDKHGGVKRFFDKPARRRMERELGRAAVRRMAALLDTYLVEAGGSVVTVARRTERIRRH